MGFMGLLTSHTQGAPLDKLGATSPQRVFDLGFGARPLCGSVWNLHHDISTVTGEEVVLFTLASGLSRVE
jgi:hypothetical protein